MNTALLEPEVIYQTKALPISEARPLTPERAAAWETFLSLPMPKRTEEMWRFANLKQIDLAPYGEPLPLDDAAREELLARSRGLEAVSGRMVFANDQLLARDLVADPLRQKGVIWLPIEQAEAEHRDLFRKHFMREEAILGGAKFAALHRSQVRAGTFLYVPRGVEIDLPIEAFHWLHGEGGSCFPHTLIIAEDLAKVTVVDHFASADENAPGLACGVNDLWLGAGANVTYVCAQNWSRKTLALQMNATVVGRDASAKALNLNLGGAYARSESVSHLRGPGGRSDMLAVTVAQGTQEFDHRTFQIHEVPNTASDLLYKNSLDDQSRTIFSGLIRVDRGAHRTDAYQKVRNLLLSDDAEANSAPGLEIEADDVRCTHGATSGQVEAEELFYLLSRGIPKKAAQKLIVFGFLNEVLERLPDAPLQDHLREMLRAKFGGHRG
ncbi:MAG: Fe-S cluster assembly protein SufD [Chthoniobacter sp.]|jgi:Fe-S cluster assembly protein SufD|nr:Fe-S cluster assembly protein SufD [Chthoniobacter sp.]